MTAALFFLAATCWCPAQTPITNAATDVSSDDDSASASAISALHQSWLSQTDPTKREALAQDLIEAAIHDMDAEGNNLSGDVVDEVARDGKPQRLLTPGASSTEVKLKPLLEMTGLHEIDYPKTPVFRRITKNRFEAWSSNEGWLFNAQGKLLTHVTVPRHDGKGREWFGAFLTDGTWITTDIWGDDQQLNAYTPTGKWKWELPGSVIVKQLPTAKPDASSEPIRPSIGWARADKTGKRWLVGMGVNWDRGFALIDPEKQVHPLPSDTHLWSQVYPRSMGVRGSYTALYIDRDDGKAALHFSEPAHCVECGWPRYATSSNAKEIVLGEGNSNFGYWPHADSFYLETGNLRYSTHILWLFDKNSFYQAEVAGSYLGDAANGHGLLVLSSDDRVVELQQDAVGPKITQGRSFTWPDGTPAVPLALYDDLHLGFFLKTSEIANEAKTPPSVAQVGLAHW